MRMRFTPARLAAAAALAVPLLCAAAQGTPALAATTKTPSVTLAAPECSAMYSVGHRTTSNTETWAYLGRDTHLYFYGSGPRTSLCYSFGSIFEITTPIDLCLQPTATGIVQAAPCNGSAAQEDWLPVQTDYPANPYVWAFENYSYPGASQCLYEDMQEPAIMTSCAFSNHFEWFYWPVAVN
jgi:hypothetical protein